MSFRHVGWFLPFPLSTPTPSTPNVSNYHVGGFPRHLALGAHPIDPQRVISTRWGLSLSAEGSTPTPMTPQRVELTRWVVFSPSPSRHPPHQPPTCRIDMLGVFLVALPSVPTRINPQRVISTRWGVSSLLCPIYPPPQQPPTCQSTRWGFHRLPSLPTPSTPNVSF